MFSGCWWWSKLRLLSCRLWKLSSMCALLLFLCCEMFSSELWCRSMLFRLLFWFIWESCIAKRCGWSSCKESWATNLPLLARLPFWSLLSNMFSAFWFLCSTSWGCSLPMIYAGACAWMICRCTGCGCCSYPWAWSITWIHCCTSSMMVSFSSKFLSSV